MMNAARLNPRSEARPPVQFYRRLNRQLDQEVVPYTVNEAMIVTLRVALGREGNPHDAGYWLLMARLAELALLCAGHYADCGEVGAAGDLLLNPRRIDIHLRGADRPVVKERHRRLSEQFNPGGLSYLEFTHWFQRNAITNIVEPALLPDFSTLLAQSGWFSQTFLDAFHDRQTQVADAMRFASTGSAVHPPITPQPPPPKGTSKEALGPSYRCCFTVTHYNRLGCDVERTCSDPDYRSPYLWPAPGSEMAQLPSMTDLPTVPRRARFDAQARS